MATIHLYLASTNHQSTKLLFMKNNDESNKSWVPHRQPFEYYPDWKAFLTMPSGEISLSKRLVLG
ncbi:hypothetical protein WP50_34315 [Lactiplantibacillus plantarum]|nr:hypothetical protein WP50_34315 [Lactiplantibacillus plantarum]